MSRDECRVLVVDDHEITRAGTSLLLQSNGYSVVGFAATAAEVVPFMHSEAVDIVLLDLGLPDMGGLTLLVELTGVFDASVVVMSGLLDGQTCDRALRMGARGIVSKSDPSMTILSALDAARRGETYLSPQAQMHHESAEPPTVRLSPRQMAILHLLLSGESNKEIGYRLRIAPPTVSFHVSVIREKLGVSTNKKIIPRAQQLGLL